ncbi:hypothetical protein AAFF_G00236220 [Aldrovandia affinis]|uniref:G-protein coupled receptors family 1 profile domain-containing protein n=1 Tax=Aldrovandia affinis TaxID=143900 RepID=A0AAD7REV3_9TELE|nr:hypothetical protein AAFF_G00236220 [Aldrovandia affinis]
MGKRAEHDFMERDPVHPGERCGPRHHSQAADGPEGPELLTVNLALTDIGMALSMYPLSIASAFSHAWIGGDPACVYYGLMGSLFSVASIMTLTALAVVRYLITGTHLHSGNRFEKKSIVTLIVFIWLYAGLWAVFPVLGWGRYGPEPFGLACSVDWAGYRLSLNGSTFIMAIAVACTFLPCAAIVISYSGIAWKLHKAYQAVESHRNLPRSGSLEKRFTLMAVLISSGFIVSWTPYVVVSFWTMFHSEGRDGIAPAVSLLPCLFAKCSTAYNPFIYYAFRRSFRRQLRQLRCCWGFWVKLPPADRPLEDKLAADGRRRSREEGPGAGAGAGAGLWGWGRGQELGWALLSLAGNALVLITSFKRRRHMKAPELLSVNLAVTDLGAAVSMYPLSIASAWSHSWLGGEPSCVYYGLMGFLFGVASIGTLTAMALVRFTVSLSLQSPKKISRRSVHVLVACTWLYALLWALLPLLGWGHYGPESFGVSCSLAWGEMKGPESSFILILFFMVLVLPALLIIGCHFGSALRLRTAYRSVNNIGQIPSAFKKQRKLVMIAVLVSVGFISSWTPYAVVSLWSVLRSSASIPPELSLLPCFFAKASTVYNPLIYYCYSKAFRNEVRGLRWLCGRGSASVEQDSTAGHADGRREPAGAESPGLRTTRRGERTVVSVVRTGW